MNVAACSNLPAFFFFLPWLLVGLASCGVTFWRANISWNMEPNRVFFTYPPRDAAGFSDTIPNFSLTFSAILTLISSSIIALVLK